MVQRVSTVAFEGIEVRPVDVQVQVAPGLPAFAIVGLPDKAVSEARDRECFDRLRAYCVANKVKRSAVTRQAIKKLLDESNSKKASPNEG
jgi:predicted ATPase with chaperone activity